MPAPVLLATTSDLFGLVCKDPSEVTALQTERATLLLTMVSAAARRVARQTFDRVADDVVRLNGTHARTLDLPEKPVASVSAATLVSPEGVETTVTDFELLPQGRLVRLSGWGGTHWTVEVTYTHGYTSVPWEVRTVVLMAAARGWANPTGNLSESVDGYALSFGGASTYDRGMQFTDAELAMLRRFAP